MSQSAELLRERDFLLSCFQTYFSRLPGLHREGFDAAILPHRYPTDFAYLVSTQERDGPVASSGRVRWKQLFIPEGRRDNAYWYYAWADRNRTLAAYGMYFSTFRVLLQDAETSLFFAATPVLGPAFQLQRLERMLSPRYLPDVSPIGESLDRSFLVCADLRSSGRGDDCPVVAVCWDDAFRWRTGQLLRSVPLFNSIHDMFQHYATAAGERGCENATPFARKPVGATARWDWEPWLEPAPSSTLSAPDQSAADADPSVVAGHLNRIRLKIDMLRAADPAYLIWDSAYHQYIMNPPLLEDERARFESSAGIRLPEAYAQFLMTLGNGGVGVGPDGLPRVEAHSDWQAFRADLVGSDSPTGDQLGIPFPLRSATLPHWADDSAYRESCVPHSAAPDLMHGSVPLATVLRPGPAGLYGRTFRLVVHGPERGHVWMDETFARKGIYPCIRRGPYSFLAWYEGIIDDMIGHVDKCYQIDGSVGEPSIYPPTSVYLDEPPVEASGA
jgi:hypothetical protein